MEVAPSFSSVLKDCTVIEGQDFVLRCSVQGIPVPQITWLLNGEFPLLQPSGPLALPAFSLGLPSFITQNQLCISRKSQSQRSQVQKYHSLLLPGWGHWASYDSYLSLEVLQHRDNVNYLPEWQMWKLSLIFNTKQLTCLVHGCTSNLVHFCGQAHSRPSIYIC